MLRMPACLGCMEVMLQVTHNELGDTYERASRTLQHTANSIPCS